MSHTPSRFSRCRDDGNCTNRDSSMEKGDGIGAQVKGQEMKYAEKSQTHSLIKSGMLSNSWKSCHGSAISECLGRPCTEEFLLPPQCSPTHRRMIYGLPAAPSLRAGSGGTLTLLVENTDVRMVLSGANSCVLSVFLGFFEGSQLTRCPEVALSPGAQALQCSCDL